VPILQICKNRRDEHLRDDNALHIKKV
jgi:hypothetical protein